MAHALGHVWLCDNAGPAWQAPCIIALGRELHNNVGLGNACGLGPSAVSSPVEVMLARCICRSFTLTHSICEKLGRYLSHVEKHEGFHFSNKWWNYSKAKHQFLFSHSHTMQGLPVNPPGHFSDFSDWWEVVLADKEAADSVKQTAEPRQTLCQKQTVTCSPCYYQPRSGKNKTLWLILNDCLPDRRWMSALFFSLQSVGTWQLCPAEWCTTLCLYHLHSV